MLLLYIFVVRFHKTMLKCQQDQSMDKKGLIESVDKTPSDSKQVREDAFYSLTSSCEDVQL